MSNEHGQRTRRGASHGCANFIRSVMKTSRMESALKVRAEPDRLAQTQFVRSRFPCLRLSCCNVIPLAVAFVLMHQKLLETLAKESNGSFRRVNPDELID